VPGLVLDYLQHRRAFPRPCRGGGGWLLPTRKGTPPSSAHADPQLPVISRS
jgi:hypothetical protein